MSEPVLVVDLDGTLLKSDVLFENFWNALGKNWLGCLKALALLPQGRAAFKAKLAEVAKLEPETLPYNQDVISYVKSWRDRGGRTALVTATNQTQAQMIAEHLALFDEVHGSDENRNLKGSTKADFLSEHFGDAGFHYVGDSTADLHVWQKAKKAITVGIPKSLKTKVAALGVETEHLRSGARDFKPYVKAMRPHQWLKNVLVFVPMFTAHQIDLATFFLSVLAFIAFGLIASSVYLVNDLLDLNSDRTHPRKCKRPLASGSLPILHGSLLAPALLAGGIVISLYLGWQFLLVMAAYYVATTAYSFNLKKRSIVDICVLAALYTVRIVAGGVATGLPLTVWLLAFSLFFFFALAAVKRQAELLDNAERGKLNVTGRGYFVDDLPIIPIMAIASGYVSILVFALYINSPAVAELYSYPPALWAICFVLLYWVSRLVMVTHRGHMHDDPLVFAAKDRNSYICAVFILVCLLTGALL
ncbi:UbiA family prenyltransferase [Roseibium sp. MMSF_3544]|uniref:UbiA family prenyltransferase n=1 Tax=unclassified Roseibium TaxID=2629323 RepID=UPI00273D5AA1|nr:UbiA family prenyltransferase [Roseibium sp. MMSF_3544]